MPQKLDSISRFSPGNCAPELLESMLVGRGELVDRLEKTVLDSVKTGAGHNWLLIGPRGAGKTHILAILYNRIDSNPEIRSRVVIAYMKEEERGVASFLDWLVRILCAFHRRAEKPPAGEDLDLGEGLESLKQLPLEQARTAAEHLLLRFVGERRLLLIAENLGEIFDPTKGMGREGQQRLRDLVQQHPFWTMVTSSQALFGDIQDRAAPFYGFFKVQHLGMFDLEEAIALLQKLARLEGRTELGQFFATEIGRGRVRAIHQLTGGNPRLLVIFYQFIDQKSIEELASPFLEMVDSLTSYYQEQMQPLPALQQKIVEFLCEQRASASVKEIARSCFITHQTASKQLSRLAERRYVIANAVGRESFYELREPLFRICFEVKENLGYPIRLFVDFLGHFYSMEELRRKYRSARLLRSMVLRPEDGGLDPADCYANFNIALTLFESGSLDAGIEQMEAAAEAGEQQDWSRSLPICVIDINEHLLLHVELDRLPDLLSHQRQIFENGPLGDSFFQGLSGALMELLKKHDEAPAERLRALCDRVIPAVAEIEGLSVACRLFATGVRYLESRDVRVLLKLPREERRALEEVLKSASGEPPRLGSGARSHGSYSSRNDVAGSTRAARRAGR